MTRTAYPYRLIIFDWDGTLRDSVGTIVGCAQAALDEMALEADPKAIRQTIGLSLAEAIPHWSPGLASERVATVRECYVHHWIHHWNDRAEFFAGVPELLDRLAERDLLLAVAGGAMQAEVLRPLALDCLGSVSELDHWLDRWTLAHTP